MHHPSSCHAISTEDLILSAYIVFTAHSGFVAH